MLLIFLKVYSVILMVSRESVTEWVQLISIDSLDLVDSADTNVDAGFKNNVFPMEIFALDFENHAFPHSNTDIGCLKQCVS